MDEGSAPPDDNQIMALFTQSHRGTLIDLMGIELTLISRDRVEGTMPVDGNKQPYGLLHGGASCVLAETLASTGAALNAWPERTAVGISLNASHHRSATEGLVRGVALPLHRGRTLSSWSIEITDSADRRICTVTMTCALREGQPM